MKTLKTCSRCILDSRILDITFNSKGECSYCRIHDKFEEEYAMNPNGEKKLAKLVDEMKTHGKHRRYDCVVGVSGGCDSSYLLYKMVELGLRPLAVHWNNNWNTQIAKTNIQKIVRGLSVDFYELGVDQAEYDDICRSFLLASVPDADIPNDIALTTALYYASDKFHLPYLLIGHSFRTEGMAPLSWSYMDGKYVESV